MFDIQHVCHRIEMLLVFPIVVGIKGSVKCVAQFLLIQLPIGCMNVLSFSKLGNAFNQLDQ